MADVEVGNLADRRVRFVEKEERAEVRMDGSFR